MKNQIITIPFTENFSSINKPNAVFITDENVFKHHSKKFSNQNVIVINAGEKFKTQTTVNKIIKQLIQLQATRSTTLIGVGGGVITDITGYVASIYMRGIHFGFVPTTLLALVDASIGGKNGIDVGVYKNMIGTINQASFILNDISFLKTLPQKEWQNGFAEIIKHACIKNATMFNQMTLNNIKFYQQNTQQLSLLIQQNVSIKTKIISNDVFENGERKLLNFGHTLGHALENQYQLSHGEAIAIGMHFACKLSEEILGFSQTNFVVDLLKKYKLPTNLQFNASKVFSILLMDKKRTSNCINFILLKKIGQAQIHSVELSLIKQSLISFSKSFN